MGRHEIGRRGSLVESIRGGGIVKLCSLALSEGDLPFHHFANGRVHAIFPQRMSPIQRGSEEGCKWTSKTDGLTCVLSCSAPRAKTATALPRACPYGASAHQRIRRRCRGCKFASSLASLSGEELFSTVGGKTLRPDETFGIRFCHGGSRAERESCTCISEPC